MIMFVTQVANVRLQIGMGGTAADGLLVLHVLLTLIVIVTFAKAMFVVAQKVNQQAVQLVIVATIVIV